MLINYESLNKQNCVCELHTFSQIWSQIIYIEKCLIGVSTQVHMYSLFMCVYQSYSLLSIAQHGFIFPQALEPVIHRDFHQSMKVIDPVRPYTPMSTPASRVTRSRLQSSRNKVSKFIITVNECMFAFYVHCRKRISCF